MAEILPISGEVVTHSTTPIGGGRTWSREAVQRTVGDVLALVDADESTPAEVVEERLMQLEQQLVHAYQVQHLMDSIHGARNGGVL